MKMPLRKWNGEHDHKDAQEKVLLSSHVIVREIVLSCVVAIVAICPSGSVDSVERGS